MNGNTGNMNDAATLFDPNANGGKARSDALPPAWPGQDPREGDGISGVVKSYDSFKSDMNDSERVPVLRLEHAVTFQQNPGGAGGKLYRAGDVGIILGAGLRRRINPEVMPKGSYVTIRYLGVDPTLRNMKMYDVFDVDRAYLGRLYRAAEPMPEAPVAQPERKSAPAASATGHDDLPF